MIEILVQVKNRFIRNRCAVERHGDVVRLVNGNGNYIELTIDDIKRLQSV